MCSISFSPKNDVRSIADPRNGLMSVMWSERHSVSAYSCHSSSMDMFLTHFTRPILQYLLFPLFWVASPLAAMLLPRQYVSQHTSCLSAHDLAGWLEALWVRKHMALHLPFLSPPRCQGKMYPGDFDVCVWLVKPSGTTSKESVNGGDMPGMWAQHSPLGMVSPQNWLKQFVGWAMCSIERFSWSFVA